MSTIVLQNTGIISENAIESRDVLMKDGVIISVKPAGSIPEGDFILDYSGKYLIPAGIDPHVHMQLPTPAGPSCDDFLNGSLAAIAGGTYAMIDFVTPGRNESLIKALENRLREVAQSKIPVKLHVGITRWDEEVSRDIEICMKKFGICSFKVYLAYRDTIGIDFDTLREIMLRIASLEGIIAVHAEEGDKIKQLQAGFISEGKTTPEYHAKSRPPGTEYGAIAKVIELVKETNCQTYIVHVSTALATEIIRNAKIQGLPVFAETCPHYLLLDESKYRAPFVQSAGFIISPPLRTLCDQEALWQGLADGTFDTVATDHCPFHYHQKAAGKDDFTKIPNGAGGIEYRLPLLYTYGVLQNRITLQQWLKLTSMNAARIFGFENWGAIRPGAKTDSLLIWDPGVKSVITASESVQTCDTCIYEGIAITGKAEPVAG